MRTILVTALIGLLCACAAPAPKADENRLKRADTQVQLARGYYDKGNLEVALERINQALELSPTSVEAHTVAAVINKQIGRVDVAASHFQQAVALEPENGDLLNNYGTLLHQQGRYAEAIEHFERAITQPFYRTPAAALSNAGASAEKQKRPHIAEDFYRRALEHDEDNPDALFRLARMMLVGDRPLRARAFLQRLESRTAPAAEMLLLGYRIECAMGDEETAQTYVDNLRSRFPDSEQSRALKQQAEGELCEAENERLRAASM